MSMTSRRLWTVLGCLGATISLVVGCRPEKPSMPKADNGPVTVSVAEPILREVTDYVDFTGRTEAKLSLDVRARVTGYLVDLPFTEGAEVKAGDKLFQIDPRPYQAKLDQSMANLALQEAQYKLAQAENRRVREANKLNAGTFTGAEIDTKQAAEDESLASVNAAKAALESDRLNVEFTDVTTPIDGQVNRYNVTLGNLVNQDQTVLTTVVSLDPMYAYFDMDEPTMLGVIRRLMAENADLLTKRKFPVLMGLADETGFPHAGYLDFANNVVSASTGTIKLRGVFENPPASSGRRLLRPGMFVRIRLPVGKPHSAVLVTERALGTDQGRKFVLIVDAQQVVQYREVAVGPLQDDGLRVITKGLAAGERVIVNGLQLVRPDAKVQTENVSMVPEGTTTASEIPAPAEKPAKENLPADASKAAASPTSATP